MKLFRFHKSFNSVVIGLVESGNFIPPEIADTMTEQAINFRSASQHLIALCECSQLRDAGLVTTNVSPLVVDLTRPLPESSSDSSIASLYPRTTPDGQGIYKDVELQAQDHQLRRDTFYLPFFQKLNAEIDRLAAQFGHASLLMMSCDNRLPDRTICVSGDVSDSDFSQPIQTAREMEIDYKVELKTESPFVEGRAASDQVNTFTLKISPASLLDGSDWSDEKSNQVREVLAALVGTLATDPK